MDLDVIVPAGTALVGIGVGYFLKSRELRRLDRIRFDDQRRSLYARALAAARRQAHQTRRLASLNAVESPSAEERAWSQDAMDRLSEAGAELSEVIEEAELLCSRRVVDALHAVDRAILMLPPVWRHGDEEHEHRVAVANAAIHDSIQAFLGAARTDLGIARRS